MANTRTRRRPAPIPTSPSEPEGKRSAHDDDELYTTLETLGHLEGYQVRLKRSDGRGGMDYIGSLPLTSDLFEDVKGQFGGGKYYGRITNQQGKYERNISFGIAGAPRGSEAAADVVAPGLTEIKTTVAEFMAEVRGLVASHAAPTVDPIAQFAAMAKIMKDIAPAPVAPTSPVDFFAMFTQMNELRESVARDMEPRDGLATVVDRGITQLVPLLDRKLDNDARALRVAPGRRAIAANAETQPVSSDPVAALAAKIPTLARAYLANLAKQDKDPQLYAEVVLDTLPETVYARLPALLGQDDFADRLCAAVPHFKPYPAWFERLAEALRASLLAESDDTSPEGTADAVSA